MDREKASRKAAEDRLGIIRALTLEQTVAGAEALRQALSDPHLSVQKNREAEIAARIFASMTLARP